VENLRDFPSNTKKALQIKADLSTVIHTTHKKECGKLVMYNRCFYAKITEKNSAGTSFVKKSFCSPGGFLRKNNSKNRVIFTN
jgi:hypothetical protein